MVVTILTHKLNVTTRVNYKTRMLKTLQNTTVENFYQKTEMPESQYKLGYSNINALNIPTPSFV